MINIKDYENGPTDTVYKMSGDGSALYSYGGGNTPPYAGMFAASYNGAFGIVTASIAATTYAKIVVPGYYSVSDVQKAFVAWNCTFSGPSDVKANVRTVITRCTVTTDDCAVIPDATTEDYTVFNVSFSSIAMNDIHVQCGFDTPEKSSEDGTKTWTYDYRPY